MTRWNGWGAETTIYPLPPSAERYLAWYIGEGAFIPDATFAQAVATVPPSRLTPQPFLSIDPADRLRHARGQSLPDWIALRSGRIGVFPDGVAYPASEDEVRSVIRFARDTGAKLVPFGGGSSVVGHINPIQGNAAVITLDLTRLNRLIHFDETSRLATFEAGVRGPDLETQLRPCGCTLGHFPQSFEFSTLGGWIAARSSGQQSYHYGRIENLFAGGHVETPKGAFDLLPLPASAAGPDLRQMILGSEGRFGVITRAIVRVRPLPQHENFYAIFFRDWASGVEAAREIAQQSISVSMLRLSDPQETETTLALSGRAPLVKWADRGLRALRYESERCLRLPLRRAVSFLHPSDHRPVFTIPWEGVTLFGTTDVDHDQPLNGDPVISDCEVDYLITALQYAFPSLALTRADVQATFSGVRSVVDTGKVDPSKESREHVMWDESGLLTVTGGKLTTFRLMAHEALESIRARLPRKPTLDSKRRVFDVPPDLVSEGKISLQRLRLCGRYGADAAEMIHAAPDDLLPVGETATLWGELRFAARAEGVIHLDDLLLRRTRLGLLLPQCGLTFMDRIRSVVQPELGWSDERWAKESENYVCLWKSCHHLPNAN